MDWNKYFIYDGDTGNLIWQTIPRDCFKTDGACATWNRRRSGKVVGHKQFQHRDGVTPAHIRVSIKGKRFVAHHIIWMMVNGPVPKGYVIDHRDCNAFNNRLDNLRLATVSQNNANIKIPKHNTSGFKGVSWTKSIGKWSANIRINNKLRWLGDFQTAIEASEAYKEAAIRLRGEFARAV